MSAASAAAAAARASRAVFIVGDVHGCVAELRALLKKANWAPPARLVFVGDLIGKGPAGTEVLRYARELKADVVLGNHEHFLLKQRAAGITKETIGDNAHPTHAQTFRDLTDEEWRWLEGLPLTLDLREPDGGQVDAVVVHAGLVPGRSLAEQTVEDACYMRRFRDSDGTGLASGEAEEGTRPWADAWDELGDPSLGLVVYGHDAKAGLQRHRKRSLGLDTGCVYGKYLTGVWLPERELVSVDAERVYEEPKG